MRFDLTLDSDDVPQEIQDGPRGWRLWPAAFGSNHMGRCGAIIIWTDDQW